MILLRRLEMLWRLLFAKRFFVVTEVRPYGFPLLVVDKSVPANDIERMMFLAGVQGCARIAMIQPVPVKVDSDIEATLKKIEGA